MLKDFEKEAIELLVKDVLSKEQIGDVFLAGEFVGYEYTGSGYFLSIRHPLLPNGRVVCDEPALSGEVDGIKCGFLVFIENGTLTLECHTWGPIDVPPDFRTKAVTVYPTFG